MCAAPIEYFLREWRILAEPSPIGEAVGHVVKITLNDLFQVQVACLNGHDSHTGVYNPENGRIEGENWHIDDCKNGTPPSKDKICCTTDPHLEQPGTWTAEDNG